MNVLQKSYVIFAALTCSSLFASLLFLQGCFSDGSREPTRIMPEVITREVDATWVDIFFRAIEEKNRNVGIEGLKDRQIADDEYEIRIYSGFGLQVFREGGHPLDLLIISFAEGEVASMHYPRWSHGPIRQTHADPEFWNFLHRHRLFDLPDSSSLDDYPTVLDGVSYVVEIKRGDAYLRYMYSNPSYSESDEAEYMLALIAFLRSQTTFETIPDRPK